MSENNREELHIKNMVCPRCELVVRETLEGLGIDVVQVELGRAVIEHSGRVSRKEMNEALQEYGFELLEGKDQKLVEQIKTLLLRYLKETEEAEENPRISDYLSKHMNQSYSALSTAFSKSEDTTIEKYLIHLKIERVKELLSYGEMTLSEIAYKLNYSSVSHLSNQFRQITGMSVTDYKKARESFRKSLDEV